MAYEFGDIFPIQKDLDDNYLVPGLRLFSKDRSLALSAWFSCLEPIKLVINKNQLILEASEDDKWLVTDLPEKDANILNTKFLENKKILLVINLFPYSQRRISKNLQDSGS